MTPLPQPIRRAWKLMRLRRDGTLGPLFINRQQVVPVGEWLPAEDHPTPGFARRPGWHTTPSPSADHLSMKGRVWCVVEIRDFEPLRRPACQGGTWLLAKWMRVVEVVGAALPPNVNEPDLVNTNVATL